MILIKPAIDLPIHKKKKEKSLRLSMLQKSKKNIIYLTTMVITREALDDFR